MEHVFCRSPCNSFFLSTWCKHAMDTLGWGEAHMNISIPTLVYHSQKYWATWPWVVYSMAHSPTHPFMPPCPCKMNLLKYSSLQAMDRRYMAPIFMYHMYITKDLAMMCCLEVGCLEGVAQLGILWRGASYIMHGECMGGVKEHQASIIGVATPMILFIFKLVLMSLNPLP